MDSTSPTQGTFPLGYFSTPSIRFAVFLFLPDSTRSAGSATTPASNALSLERQKDLYDGIILPAANETVRNPMRQEIHRSFDMVYAKSRSYQERPDMGRGNPETSRAFRLTYTIPAEDMPALWHSIVAKANELRCQTRRGEPAAYFQSPKLLLQAHDLKNTFAAPTLDETLARLEKTRLTYIDPSQVDMRSCSVDIGTRDYATHLGSREPRRSEPFTLLWKSQCNRRLQQRLLNVTPDGPLVATHYRSFLLRDVGTLTTSVRRTKAPNLGHPDCGQTGIAEPRRTLRTKSFSRSCIVTMPFSDPGFFLS